MRERLIKWGPPQLVAITSILVLAIGIVVLIGWASSNPLDSLGRTKPNTAIALCALAIALYLLRKGEHSGPRARTIAMALSSIAALIALLTLLEYILSANFGIDDALIPKHFLAINGIPAGRMPPASALSLLFLSTSLLLSKFRLNERRLTPSQIFALAAALIGGLAIVGYIYGVRGLYAIGPFGSMALISAVSMVTLAFGALWTQPDRGVMAEWRSPSASGRFTRKMIPPVVLLPIGFGWLSRLGEDAGYYGPGAALALFAIASISSLTVLVGWAASSLGKFEAEGIAANDELQKQLHIQRAILESIGEGVVVADRQGKFVQWNSAAEAIVRAQQTMGAPDQWPEQYGVFAADKTTRLATQNTPVRRAIRGEHVDGVEVFFREPSRPEGVWLSVSARQLRSGDGAVAVFRDITAQKSAQEQLMVTDRMVSMGMLAAGVAHEINNPLAAVIANLDLSMSMIGREQRELVDQMTDAREGAERVRTIARDLKVFSRIDEDKRELVELEGVLESSLRMAWNEIRHRAQLKKDYRPTPRVDANESRLGQVFLNLIVNAAQSIGEGHSDKNEIRVSTRTQADGRAVVEISDTGSGMTPEVKDRLFTPFFTTKPSGFGSGLGLAICQRIVNGIGGTIEVESELGKGSTFRVLLPAAPQQKMARSISSEQRAVQLAPKRRGRVLVVDDEAAIGATIRRVLSSEHDVLTLTSAEDAVDRIRKGARYDVIICDLMMPVMTGQELYTELLRLAPEQAERVVFLTGGAFTEGARAFLEAIENEKLEKPFDAETIRSVVRHRVRNAS